MTTEQTPGILYVVGTPIGNLGDMTYRAIETLNKVDLILAEDTRSFGRLKQHFSITTPVKSYHDHSESRMAPIMLKRLLSGEDIALTSEAGTPCINDPGYRLVNLCRSHKIIVTPIPGACAAIAALAVSGFEIHRFQFEGFVPPKPGKRRKALEAALNSELTCVFYESPHRLIRTLTELYKLEPQSDIMVARELTKLHEECVQGSVEEVLKTFDSRAKIKGEIVLLIRGRRSAKN